MLQKTLLLNFSLNFGVNAVKRIFSMPAFCFLFLEIATLAFVGALQRDSTTCTAWLLCLLDFALGVNIYKWIFFFSRLHLIDLYRFSDIWFELPKLRNWVQVIVLRWLILKTIDVFDLYIFALFFRLLTHLLCELLGRSWKRESLWSS